MKLSGCLRDWALKRLEFQIRNKNLENFNDPKVQSAKYLIANVVILQCRPLVRAIEKPTSKQPQGMRSC